MERKAIIIFLPLLIALVFIHVLLNFYVFPMIEQPIGDILKHTYEGVSLGIYTGVVYLIAYLTKGIERPPNSDDATTSNRSANVWVQGLLLAFVLFVGFRVTEALVNVFITVFDDLRMQGEILGASEYGMSVIDRMLSGFLFFFGWLPLCVYAVSRCSRKLSRNPGFIFFFIVSLIVLFGSILTNYQSANDWSDALVQTLAPIFGSRPVSIHSRDVLLFVTVQALGTLFLSVLLSTFMWLVAGLRMRVTGRLSSIGV